MTDEEMIEEQNVYYMAGYPSRRCSEDEKKITDSEDEKKITDSEDEKKITDEFNHLLALWESAICEIRGEIKAQETSALLYAKHLCDKLEQSMVAYAKGDVEYAHFSICRKMTITSYFGLKPCCDCGRTGNYTVNKNGYQFTVCADCVLHYLEEEEE